MEQILVEGRPAALVQADRIWLLDWVEQLPDEHPTRRWVLAVGLCAMHQLDGPEPYDRELCEWTARLLMMPSEELWPLLAHSDRALGEHFGIPVEQVARRIDALLTDGLPFFDMEAVTAWEQPQGDGSGRARHRPRGRPRLSPRGRGDCGS